MSARLIFSIGAGAMLCGAAVLIFGGNIFGFGATTQTDVNKTAISRVERELESLRSNLGETTNYSDVEKYKGAFEVQINAVHEAVSHLKPPTREVFDVFDLCGVFLFAAGLGMVLSSQIGSRLRNETVDKSQ